MDPNVAIVKTVAAKPHTEIIARLKELKSQVKQNENERVKLNIEIGLQLNKLKEVLPGPWIAKVDELGFSRRVVSRLMKAAKVLAPSGTLPARLAARLPADPIKLENLCALDLMQIEELSKEINLRNLDREEIAKLVGKKLNRTPRTSTSVKPATVAEEIRESWRTVIEGIFTKLNKVEVEDREGLIAYLEESIDVLKESLHTPEGKTAQDDADTDEDDEEKPAEEEQAGDGEGSQPDQVAPATEPQKPEIPDELRPTKPEEAAKATKTTAAGNPKEAQAPKPAAKATQPIGRRQ